MLLACSFLLVVVDGDKPIAEFGLLVSAKVFVSRQVEDGKDFSDIERERRGEVLEGIAILFYNISSVIVLF